MCHAYLDVHGGNSTEQDLIWPYSDRLPCIGRTCYSLVTKLQLSAAKNIVGADNLTLTGTELLQHLLNIMANVGTLGQAATCCKAKSCCCGLFMLFGVLACTREGREAFVWLGGAGSKA